MRIAVVALDTRGGVQPYTALALGLREAGHDVRMVVHADAAPAIAARGIATVALTGNAEEAVRESGAAGMNPVARRRFMLRMMRATVGEQARQALTGCADVDLVTAGVGGSVIGTALAEKLGLPFVEAQLQPLGPATAAFPGPLFPHVPTWLGRPGTRLSHRLTTLGVRALLGPGVKRVRAVYGLPARPAPRTTRTPILYGYSPVVVPAPQEWGPDRHVTGYWTLRDGDTWTPPDALTAFLAAGPPPVCVGFGSMVGDDPAGLAALVREAVRRAGARAVLLSGWGGLAAVADDDVLVLDQAPHDWLFPRCGVVVHHGGAGTTGAGVRAGVPAVVVPFGADQPFWASRVAALGIGPPPIPRRRLTAATLTWSLLAAAAPAVRRRAAEVGDLVRAEDGVGAAVAHYEAVAARLHRS